MMDAASRRLSSALSLGDEHAVHACLSQSLAWAEPDFLRAATSACPPSSSGASSAAAELSVLSQSLSRNLRSPYGAAWARGAAAAARGAVLRSRGDDVAARVAMLTTLREITEETNTNYDGMDWVARLLVLLSRDVVAEAQSPLGRRFMLCAPAGTFTKDDVSRHIRGAFSNCLSDRSAVGVVGSDVSKTRQIGCIPLAVLFFRITRDRPNQVVVSGVVFARAGTAWTKLTRPPWGGGPRPPPSADG